MDSSNLTRRRHGEEGNVAVAVAVLLALVVAAGFFVLFYLRVQNVSPATPSGVPSTSPVSPLDESQDPGGLRELPVVEVGDGEATAPEDPEPEPTDKGLRIHGKVTNPDGKGVAGALVRYMPGPAFLRRNIRNDLIVLSDSEETELVFQPEAGVSIPSVSARTDAEGAYELHIEPGGREGGLIAHAQGHTMEKRELADHLPQADPEIPSPQEAAEEGEPLQPQEARINFVLEPGGSISGAVTVRATGAPAAGMIVRAVKIEPGTPARFQLLRGNAPSASVHSEGAYSIGGLEPGDYRVFPMTGSSDFVGISPRQATPVLLLQGSQVTGIDFEVARGGAISGQVSSAQGDPIEGATVRLLPANFMQAAMRGDLDSFAPGDEEGHTTGEDGGYRISGVPFESEFSVLAGARGHAPAGERSVKVTEEHPERRVDLIVTRGSTISGTAFFEDETLAPETPVMLMPDLQEIMSGSSALLAFNDGVNSVTTDARGNFMIEHLPAGSYNISAGEGIAYNPFGGGGAAVVEVDGIHDVTGVEVTVTRAAEPGEPAGEGPISGRVMDDQGMPLEKVEVSASSMEPGVAWSSSVKTDAEGRFQVVGYRATTGRLRASLKGYA
ncbi:MAG: collagen binding domain-containing protein, partial [Planctomycetota bacterium]